MNRKVIIVGKLYGERKVEIEFPKVDGFDFVYAETTKDVLLDIEDAVLIIASDINCIKQCKKQYKLPVLAYLQNPDTSLYQGNPTYILKEALECGVDNIVFKGCSKDVAKAYIMATANLFIIECGDLKLDKSTYKAYLNGKDTGISKNPFLIFEKLLTNANTPQTYDDLYEYYDPFGDVLNVHSAVSFQINKMILPNIGKYKENIVNIPSVGYVWKDNVK